MQPTLTDIISKDLTVIFCGINPGLKSAWDGHHFSGKKQVLWGPQPEDLFDAKIWVLPNPSGLNRGFTLNDLVVHYRQMFCAIQQAGNG